jgi:hypothetical protein
VIRVCPRCRGMSQNTFLCPRCGIQTQEAEVAVPETVQVAPDPPTLAGGLLLGLLVAQGLTYALRHLATAAVLAYGAYPNDMTFWSSSEGNITLLSIQAVALFVAAVFAGAGQARPVIVGTSLGALNALLFMLFQILIRQPIDPLTWAQPFVHAVVGLIGSTIGWRIWQPSPALPALASTIGPGEAVLSTVLPDEPELVEIEPFPWLRFVVGTVVAVGGTIGARWIRDFVVLAGGGAGHEMQSLFITWQIAAIAQVLGGIFVGANSRQGAIYGFWVGIFAAALIIVIPTLTNAQTADVSAWILGQSAADSRPAALMIQGIQSLIFGFMGGWLGALILPSAAVARSRATAAR